MDEPNILRRYGSLFQTHTMSSRKYYIGRPLWIYMDGTTLATPEANNIDLYANEIERLHVIIIKARNALKNKQYETTKVYLNEA